MIEVKVKNIVASKSLAEKFDLDMIAQSIEETEYEPEQFSGLVYRLDNPKTATLLFRIGAANCTSAKSLEEVETAVKIISEKLEKIAISIKKNPKIVIQNIVATADLGGELNLSETAVSLGLENVEYELEQFPGLVYRIKEPRVAILFFGSCKIVCAGAKNLENVSLAIENLSQELTSLGLF